LVTVVGTEERGGLNVWRYTVYITEIRIGSVDMKVNICIISDIFTIFISH